MALRAWGVREALTGANTRLVPLQTDIRLDAAAHALIGELVQANTLALNALRADDTIPAGQRNARSQQVHDKVFALDNVCRAHDQVDMTTDELYNALNLSLDSADAIAAGLPTFLSDLGPGL